MTTKHLPPLHPACCWAYRTDKVDEYAKRLSGGSAPPPVTYFEGALVDGRHRLEAWVKIGRDVSKHPSIELPAGQDPWEYVYRQHAGARTPTVSELVHQIQTHMRACPEITEAQAIKMACGGNTDAEKAAKLRLAYLKRAPKAPVSTATREMNRLLEHARGPITFGELLEKLDVGPAKLRSLIKEAGVAGHTVNVDMTPTLSDRQEHRLRAELRELTAAKKHLLEELERRESQIETLTALAGAPVAPVTAKRGRGEGKRRQGALVMLLSDLHVEEPVVPEKVNGMNEYNLDIAERCIERCAEAFEYFANDPRWDIRTGILGILGDTYSGYIHAELAETNFLSPVQAVLWVQERLEKLIRYVLAHTKVERLIIVCKDGNHGRLTMKVRAQTRTENSLEWLMYKQLAARFAGEKRIEFVVEDGLYTYIDVYDETLIATHGDQFRYQGGVGGLLIPVRRGLNEIRKYRPGLKRNGIFCMGHFHERMDVGDIVINGSAIGVTPYSLSINAKPERRSQHIFMVDAARGKDAPTAPVWLPLK